MDKLKSIYFLRGVAALAVVCQHAFRHDMELPSDALWLRIVHDITNYGYLGVALFFVISGFCIHLRTARGLRLTGNVRLEWRDFWWRRIHRLYPPYLVMLLISMSLWVYVYATGGANIYPDRGAHWLAIDFVAHLFMLHGFHPALDQGAGNPAYWTLAREEYFYLMYAGVFILLRRLYGIRKTMCFVLLSGMITYLISHAAVPENSPWQRIVMLSPIYLWIQWTLGALAVEAHLGNVKLPRWCYWLALFPVWFAFGCFVRTRLPVLEPAAWGMAFFTLLNYCVRREGEGRWPESFPFRWLFSIGIFSYSMYLAHPVMTAAVRRVTRDIKTDDPVTYILFGVLIVLCCIASGKAYYELVERHFLNTSPKARATRLEPLPPPVPQAEL
jgi:peptidoglycan/LPS O-acetylase OafA/YrhL